MRVCVLGLGEAGSLIAADLVRAGADVHAFDPADTPTPPGVERHDHPAAAVAGASVVMAITAAADSLTALKQVAERLSESSLYADLATASPTSKQQLAEIVAARGADFVDVALMAPVPTRGLSTPALASGTGAERYSGLVNPLGANVEVVAGDAGSAAARKLMRSIVTKGLAALVIEVMDAADAQGEGEWMWGHIIDLLTTVDEVFLDRLMSGTSKHAVRRLEEMETVVHYLSDLAVSPHMAAATVERLRPFITAGDGD